MHKSNSQDSGNPDSYRDKDCSSLKLTCKLTEMKPEIGYYSYYRMLCFIMINQ